MLRLLGNRVLSGRGRSAFWGGWKTTATREEEREAGGSGGSRLAPAHRDAAYDLTQAIQRSKEAVYQLDKRQQHVERRIKHQEAAARQSVAAGDKRGALLCLRRKKLFEDDLQQLLTSRMALETQIVSLEAAHTQQLAVQAMAGAAKAHRSFSQKLSLGKIDKLIDDIQGQQDAQQEVTQVLAQNIPLLDDEELQQELQQIELEEMEERVYRLACSIPSVPATNDNVDAAVADLSTSLGQQDSLSQQQQQEKELQKEQEQQEPHKPVLLKYQPVAVHAAARGAHITQNTSESLPNIAASTTGTGSPEAINANKFPTASTVLCGGSDRLLVSPRSGSPACLSNITEGSTRSTHTSSSSSNGSSRSSISTTTRSILNSSSISNNRSTSDMICDTIGETTATTVANVPYSHRSSSTNGSTAHPMYSTFDKETATPANTTPHTYRMSEAVRHHGSFLCESDSAMIPPSGAKPAASSVAASSGSSSIHTASTTAATGPINTAAAQKFNEQDFFHAEKPSTEGSSVEGRDTTPAFGGINADDVRGGERDVSRIHSLCHFTQDHCLHQPYAHHQHQKTITETEDIQTLLKELYNLIERY